MSLAALRPSCRTDVQQCSSNLQEHSGNHDKEQSHLGHAETCHPHLARLCSSCLGAMVKRTGSSWGPTRHSRDRTISWCQYLEQKNSERLLTPNIQAVKRWGRRWAWQASTRVREWLEWLEWWEPTCSPLTAIIRKLQQLDAAHKTSIITATPIIIIITQGRSQPGCPCSAIAQTSVLPFS